MKKNLSLSEALQNLQQEGYHLADAAVAHMPDESIRSNDWKLDLMQQVFPDYNQPDSSLVIAVSSAKRSMKLVFVEASYSRNSYNPMQLLRKLFPFSAKK